uniref:TRMT1-like protein n=2 Tax=Lygus hesperus TaxID=30085 RepID=A0A146LPU8_LYGHE
MTSNCSSWVQENGVEFLANESSVCQRKSAIYYNKEYAFNRSLVVAILEEYVKSGLSKCMPVRCLDLLGGPGVNGLLWRKRLAELVEVIVNAQGSEEIVKENFNRNELQGTVYAKDPCVILHERGYNFVYIDCTIEASIYFDAVFRNVARNGVVIITTKDDSSLHGGTYDVALRRYGGRIVRTHYANELGIRLFLASLARSAARYSKAIKVLCCTVYKSSFTVAVMAQKGPENANKCLGLLRNLKHCMVCEERKFYPPNEGFPTDGKNVRLNCKCASDAPGETALELGPLWSGNIFDSEFLESTINNNRSDDCKVNFTLTCMLEEARCPSKVDSEVGGKRLKLDFSSMPPFYYNLHKHHPEIAHVAKLSKVVDRLQLLGYRASKTHFDPLAVRTNAPLNILFQVMKDEASKICK